MSSLLSLSLENYRSFYTRQTIEFGEEKMRAVTGVYGANAGGKSNIAKALQLIEECVLNSAEANWRLPFDPFVLREGASSEPSYFEIKFAQNDDMYQFAFAYDASHIIFEELKEKPANSSKMKTIYRRTASEGLNATAERFGFGKKMLAKTRPETLLITKGREDNNKYSNIVFEFLSHVIVDLDLVDRDAFFVDLLKGDESLRSRMLELLKKCDFAIRDIKVEGVEVPEELLSSLPIPEDVKRGMVLQGANSFRTVHAVRDAERSITRMQELDFWSQESAGTQRFFKTAVPILAALDQGGIVYLDEFGSSMHPLLVDALIKLFLDDETRGGASLIFNTHDTTVMKTALTRDSIVLVEKNAAEESVITPLMKRGVREGEAIEKRYREGLYGGIPLIRNEEDSWCASS